MVGYNKASPGRPIYCVMPSALVYEGRCIYRASRPSQGTVNGGAVSE